MAWHPSWAQVQGTESSPFTRPPGQSSPLLSDTFHLLAGSSLLDTWGLCSPRGTPTSPSALSSFWVRSLTLKPGLRGPWTLKGSETQKGAWTLTRTLELMAAKQTCRRRYVPRKSLWAPSWTGLTVPRTRTGPLPACTAAHTSHPETCSHGSIEGTRLRVSTKAQENHTCSATQLPASWADQETPCRKV